MTKADLVDSIYERIGLSKKESIQIVELVFEIMRSELEKGNKVKISGFGNFNVRDKNIRRGRNPQTGESLMLDARKVVTFKPSGLLRKKVNGK